MYTNQHNHMITEHYIIIQVNKYTRQYNPIITEHYIINIQVNIIL
jgi:hypothetical protein